MLVISEQSSLAVWRVGGRERLTSRSLHRARGRWQCLGQNFTQLPGGMKSG